MRVGAILKLPSPDVVEVLSTCGLDFVIADAEHGPIGPETCQQMVRAGEAMGIPVLVRIGETTSAATVTRYLDTGVSGVHLSQVRSAVAARGQTAQLVHPPYGVRGLAGGRWAVYGKRGGLPALVDSVPRELCVVAQIEDAKACAAVDEILAVDEVDVFFVGATDLAASLGARGDRNDPRARDLAAATLSRIAAAGGVAGMVAATPDEATWGVELGARYIVFNAESLLQWGARRGLDAVERAPRRGA